jgi:protein-tyrosine phosphatase
VPSDFDRFDLILGMDQSNCDELMAIAPQAARDRIHLFTGYAGMGKIEVPDPYYGGADGFLAVYRMIRDASEALAARLDWRASEAVSGQASSTIYGPPPTESRDDIRTNRPTRNDAAEKLPRAER